MSGNPAYAIERAARQQAQRQAQQDDTQPPRAQGIPAPAPAVVSQQVQPDDSQREESGTQSNKTLQQLEQKEEKEQEDLRQQIIALEQTHEESISRLEEEHKKELTQAKERENALRQLLNVREKENNTLLAELQSHLSAANKLQGELAERDQRLRQLTDQQLSITAQLVTLLQEKSAVEKERDQLHQQNNELLKQRDDLQRRINFMLDSSSLGSSTVSKND